MTWSGLCNAISEDSGDCKLNPESAGGAVVTVFDLSWCLLVLVLPVRQISMTSSASVATLASRSEYVLQMGHWNPG